MDVKNNQIYFNVKDNKVSVKTRGPASLEDIVQITMSGLLGAMRACVKAAPENAQEELKGYIYDRFNQAAGNVLSYFGPEFEESPSLTTDAILKMENELLKEEINKKKKDPDYKMKY